MGGAASVRQRKIINPIGQIAFLLAAFVIGFRTKQRKYRKKNDLDWYAYGRLCRRMGNGEFCLFMAANVNEVLRFLRVAISFFFVFEDFDVCSLNGNCLIFTQNLNNLKACLRRMLRFFAWRSFYGISDNLSRVFFRRPQVLFNDFNGIFSFLSDVQ